MAISTYNVITSQRVKQRIRSEQLNGYSRSVLFLDKTNFVRFRIGVTLQPRVLKPAQVGLWEKDAKQHYLARTLLKPNFDLVKDSDVLAARKNKSRYYDKLCRKPRTFQIGDPVRI